MFYQSVGERSMKNSVVKYDRIKNKYDRIKNKW